MSLFKVLQRFMEHGSQPLEKKAKVLAVVAQKGGVGKTTTAVNLAVAAARFHARRTLLIDLDGQGHVDTALSAHLLGANGRSVCMSDMLLGNNRDICEIIQPTRIDRLFVTPSDKGLAATEGIIASRIGREFLLRTVLRTAYRVFDLIIIDSPPNLGNLTINALMAADACLVPCDMSILALSGVRDLCAVLETLRERLNHPIMLIGVVATRIDKRNKKLMQAIFQELKALYADVLCQTNIPVCSALAQAQIEGLNIFDYAPGSQGAQAYERLAEEVLSRLNLGSHLNLSYASND